MHPVCESIAPIPCPCKYPRVLSKMWRDLPTYPQPAQLRSSCTRRYVHTDAFTYARTCMYAHVPENSRHYALHIHTQTHTCTDSHTSPEAIRADPDTDVGVAAARTVHLGQAPQAFDHYPHRRHLCEPTCIRARVLQSVYVRVFLLVYTRFSH